MHQEWPRAQQGQSIWLLRGCSFLADSEPELGVPVSLSPSVPGLSSFSGCWHQCSVETWPIPSLCLGPSGPLSPLSAPWALQPWPRQGTPWGHTQEARMAAGRWDTVGSPSSGVRPALRSQTRSPLTKGSLARPAPVLSSRLELCETGGHIGPACSLAASGSLCDLSTRMSTWSGNTLSSPITVIPSWPAGPALTWPRTWKLDMAGFLAGPLVLAWVHC